MIKQTNRPANQIEEKRRRKISNRRAEETRKDSSRLRRQLKKNGPPASAERAPPCKQSKKNILSNVFGSKSSSSLNLPSRQETPHSRNPISSFPLSLFFFFSFGSFNPSSDALNKHHPLNACSFTYYSTTNQILIQ